MFSRELKNFLSVAELSSITAAAEILHVSQPALTKSIQKLETEMGTKLFDRVPKGVQLTKSGEILEHHARVMENEFRHATARIAELSGVHRGNLRIGAGPVWLVKILPPVIAEFQKTNPDIRVTLVGGVITTLLPALISGELDLICVSLDFTERPEVKPIPLFDMNHVVIVDPSHPLANMKDISADALVDQRWLTMKNDYVVGDRISAFFAANGLQPPNISLETTSIHSLLGTLQSGNYVAFVPEQMLEIAEEKGLVKLDLKETLWQTKSGLAVRSSAKTSTALADFIDAIRSATEIYSTT